MFKFALVAIVLLVSSSSVASAQMVYPTPTEQATPEPSKLEVFLKFWQGAADEAAKNDQAFCVEVEATAKAIVEGKEEIRKDLNHAYKALNENRIPEFIILMNAAEGKIRVLKKQWDTSTKKEEVLYYRILKMAASRARGPRNNWRLIREI
jgi:hypothetical protein